MHSNSLDGGERCVHFARITVNILNLANFIVGDSLLHITITFLDF